MSARCSWRDTCHVALAQADSYRWENISASSSACPQLLQARACACRGSRGAVPSRTGEAVRPSGAHVCGKSSKGCVQRASLPVLVAHSWGRWLCRRQSSVFYFLVTSARGRGDGVSVAYLVKGTVPRPKAAAGSAGS